ncbi:MAG: AAA family ATPase [Chitinivibrionales bacterium]|nr:AAA family ATPase [Chitinivibrionales bacterium]
MYNRILNIGLSSIETCFLWGPRQIGKSTLLRKLFPNSPYFDLLQSDQFLRFSQTPSRFREECRAIVDKSLSIIVDEVQKVPLLLDEIHWLIENEKLRFILCGSSARRVKRGHANLLGGRAVRYELFPLVYPEIPGFDLERALNHGLLPRHYSAEHAPRLIQSYVADYLQNEIVAESLVRSIPSFGRFLEIAALTNGELINYAGIASDCGVSAMGIKGYFQILEDTLLGRFLPAFRKRAKRRQVNAPKFYLFDVGIVAHLAKRGRVERGSELFGRAFEHFLFMELTAYLGYSEKLSPLSYWRTVTGFEVDFVIGEGEIAIEAKSSDVLRTRHFKSLRAFREEFKPRRSIIVSLDPAPRKTDDGIEILPWNIFLQRLWAGEIIK